MRVLLVSDSYPPLIGGATRTTHLLARGLFERGHQVAVATISQQGAPAREVLDGVHVQRLGGLTLRLPMFAADPYRNNPPPFPDPETTLRLRRLVASFAPDVVNAYGWMTYSCAVALLGMGVPMVLSARDYGNVCAKRTLVRREAQCSGPAALKCATCSSDFYGAPKGLAATFGVLLGRGLIRRRAVALHSVSNHVADVMAAHLGVTDGTVIPSFRELVEPEVGDTEVLARLPDQPFMLFVGALRRIKGLDQLLEAYERLETDVPLVLIGTRAPDTPARFPAGVTVLEKVSFPTVIAAWERALFGVFPSVWAEPFGNVLHEAMSRGRPVIGTVPSGHSDMVVEGENGLLVPAGDADALREAMARLLGDEQLRARMGINARARAAAYTPDEVIPRFEALYESVTTMGG